MRADQLLVQRGLAASRSQAARLIDAGARWQQRGLWRPLRKSDELDDTAVIELDDAAQTRYVSRGGVKLEGALRTSGVSVDGKVCLDIGQSTGGFTDCLLQHGARAVIGVDVGHGQLHPSLRVHPQVACIEKTNARTLDATYLIALKLLNECGSSLFNEQNPQVDTIVGDVSFISQTLLVASLAPLLVAGGAMLMLVKPQFELQPEQIGKGGIVKDAAHYVTVEQRIRSAYSAQGLHVQHFFESPIQGGDGNREFFVHAIKPPTGAPL
jgi:23S rRNA (cytidine1920-2'-O)/16S rRNA (cytidine1409-2'-O)-methyltransferase